MSDPENVFDLACPDPINMRVQGVLAPAGTADDGAIFTDYKTEWIILGIMHGHQDVAKVDENRLLWEECNQSDRQRGRAAVSRSHRRQYHSLPHAWRRGEISRQRDHCCAARHEVLNDFAGRYEDPKAAMQLLAPKQVISETLDLVFRVKRFFDAQALLVGGAMALLLALVVLLSLRLRRGEMETMFKIGCARWMIFGMQAAEILIVVAAGVATAAALTWCVIGRFGIFKPAVRHSPFDGATDCRSSVAPGWCKPRVGVVNYPLWYFTNASPGTVSKLSFRLRAMRTPRSGNRTRRESGSISRPT